MNESANDTFGHRRTRRAIVIVAGAVGMIVALIVALFPVRTSQLNYPSCGSVLAPAGGGNFTSGNATWNMLDNAYFRTLCEDALEPMGWWAIVLGAVGLILIFWGITIRTSAGASRGVSERDAEVAGQLLQLARLKDSGALTESEFAVAKRRVLGDDRTDSAHSE